MTVSVSGLADRKINILSPSMYSGNFCLFIPTQVASTTMQHSAEEDEDEIEIVWSHDAGSRIQP
jgi:hypothetical protein